MICIGSGKIFDPKIINAETKFGGTSVVFPKTGRLCMGKDDIVGSKLVHEVLVCKECSCLSPYMFFF